jgi:hypothetical protein
MNRTPIETLLTLALAVAATGVATAAETPAKPFSPSIAGRDVAAQTVRSERTLLRRLGVTAGDLTFAGEAAIRRHPVYVAANEVLATSAFRLTFQNTVGVLPEASTLTVQINDTVIGTTAIDAVNRPVSIDLKVPPGVLVEGYNAVQITARQQHRVDCSIRGTWELVTEVDPARTGLVVAAAEPVIRTVADLQKLPGSGDGAMVFRAAAATDTAEINDTIEAAETLALLAGGDKARLVFSDEAMPGPVIDLVIGGEGRFRDRFGFSGARIEQAAGVLIGRSPDRPGFAVAVDRRHLAELSVSAEKRRPKGSPAAVDIVQSRLGRPVVAGVPIAVPELGRRGIAFTGRLLHVATTVNLPTDFYPGNYGAAELRLAGAYAPGLDSQSGFSVRVNGIPFGGNGLIGSAGGRLDGQSLRLPYSAFKPGTNTIEFEADLSRAADAACSPGRDFGRPRLILGADTTLTFDGFARATSTPDLGATLANGDLAAFDGGPILLDVSAADPRYLDVAAAYVLRLATTSGRVRPVDVVFGRHGGEGRSTVFVGPAAEMAQTTVAEVPRRIGRSGRVQVSELSSLAVPGRPVADDGAPLPSVVAEAVTAEPGAASALVETEAPTAVGGRFGGGELIGGAIRSGLDGVRAAAGVLVDRLTPHGPMIVPDRSVPAGAVVFTQQATLPIGTDPWGTFWQTLIHGRGTLGLPSTSTTIAAVDADTLVKGVSRLVERDDWFRIVGASALYDVEGGNVAIRSPGNGLLVADPERSIANGRRLVAGWFGQNNLVYLVVVLICSLLFGTFAMAAVRSRRR